MSFEKSTDSKTRGQLLWRPKASPVRDGGEQPSGNNENTKAESQVLKAHGPATKVTITHDHEGGKHSVESQHADNYTHSGEYSTSQLAHQAGGILAAANVKKATSPDQQGAASEGDNSSIDSFEMPELI